MENYNHSVEAGNPTIVCNGVAHRCCMLHRYGPRVRIDCTHCPIEHCNEPLDFVDRRRYNESYKCCNNGHYYNVVDADDPANRAYSFDYFYGGVERRFRRMLNGLGPHGDNRNPSGDNVLVVSDYNNDYPARRVESINLFRPSFYKIDEQHVLVQLRTIANPRDELYILGVQYRNYPGDIQLGITESRSNTNRVFPNNTKRRAKREELQIIGLQPTFNQNNVIPSHGTTSWFIKGMRPDEYRHYNHVNYQIHGQKIHGKVGLIIYGTFNDLSNILINYDPLQQDAIEDGIARPVLIKLSYVLDNQGDWFNIRQHGRQHGRPQGRGAGGVNGQWPRAAQGRGAGGVNGQWPRAAQGRGAGEVNGQWPRAAQGRGAGGVNRQWPRAAQGRGAGGVNGQWQRAAGAVNEQWPRAARAAGAVNEQWPRAAQGRGEGTRAPERQSRGGSKLIKKIVKSKSTKPKSVKSKSTKPKSVKSQSTKPKSVKSQSTKPKSTKPKSTKPKSTKSKSTKSKSTKSKSTKSKSTKPISTK